MKNYLNFDIESIESIVSFGSYKYLILLIIPWILYFFICLSFDFFLWCLYSHWRYKFSPPLFHLFRHFNKFECLNINICFIPKIYKCYYFVNFYYYKCYYFVNFLLIYFLISMKKVTEFLYWCLCSKTLRNLFYKFCMKKICRVFYR